MKTGNKVFFNASVILAGLYSPKGGSAKLLHLVHESKINGVISEIILDEATRHSDKINITARNLESEIIKIFKYISPAPNASTVQKYYPIVKDHGDAHILASCEEEKCPTLVSLDKAHILVLKGKVNGLHIVAPGEFLRERQGF